MIRICDVSKSFDNQNILDNVSLTIDAGERAALVGPGGCGKSTLLKILLGLVSPDSGSTELMNVSMTHSSIYEREQILKSVGMAFQQGGLFDFMTVEENLSFAMKHMTDFSAEAIHEKIQKLLLAIKLPRISSLYPHELSGGMKRRVGIARALATEPTIALFDEPTSGLDPVTSTIILNMINELAQSQDNSSLIVATSNVEIAIRFAPRIIVLHEGKIIADGPWRDLLTEGSPWVQHFLSVRLIGLSPEYALELNLPHKFFKQHWPDTDWHPKQLQPTAM
ncbi:MAG: ABC transporter ATP-binding protein [Oligoflexales bacterium]